MLEEPAGSRNGQRSMGHEDASEKLRQLSGEPMPDPSMTAAAASHIGSAATSVVGHLLTSPASQAVSARPLEADIVSLDGYVGCGPNVDIATCPIHHLNAAVCTGSSHSSVRLASSIVRVIEQPAISSEVT